MRSLVAYASVYENTRLVALVTVLSLSACAHPRPLPAPAAMSEADRQKSDTFAMTLLELEGALSPESIAEIGVEGLDEAVTDWSEGADERALEALSEAARHFRTLRASEPSPAVAQDLALLEQAAGQAARERELLGEHMLPWLEPAGVVFEGLAQPMGSGDPARQAAALVRLRKYVGLSEGSAALAVQAEARTRTALSSSPPRLFPQRSQVERYLAQSPLLMAEIEALFAGVPDARPLLDTLSAQLQAYDAFLESEILPEARADFRVPPEIYAFELQQRGIDLPPRDLASRARQAFSEIQAEMQTVAAEVARERGLSDPDYRAVIASLKREQVTGEALEALYRDRIAQLQAILRREELVTVPERPLSFRIASVGESSMMPAPMYRPPPLLDNRGEHGTFVLPARDPSEEGQGYDDFSFEAASWWLTAHEGRPGHDLQYSVMVEHPQSLARSVFAFNSVNVEGWGLYAEAMIEPHAPPEARLVLLQARLMRAAHAFLDIELNLGMIEPDEVRRVMVEEVVFSPAWAETCLQRYTSLMPGQAPSYFYGYLRLVELRRAAEAQYGRHFDARAFHDALLAQGLLPPDLLKEAILGRSSP